MGPAGNIVSDCSAVQLFGLTKKHHSGLYTDVSKHICCSDFGEMHCERTFVDKNTKNNSVEG